MSIQFSILPQIVVPCVQVGQLLFHSFVCSSQKTDNDEIRTITDDLKSNTAPLKTLLCHSLDGSYKKEGEMWSIDPCTNCICHMGQILCDARECPPTPCQKPIKDDDNCCPYCPDESRFLYILV